MERFGSEGAVDLDEDDMELVVQQIWRSRCAVTGKRFGGHVLLTLTRWDCSRPPVADNLVLLMQSQARLLAEKGHAAFEPFVVQRVTSRLSWASAIVSEDNDFVRRDTEAMACSVSDRESIKTSSFDVGSKLCFGVLGALFGFNVARWGQMMLQ